MTSGRGSAASSTASSNWKDYAKEGELASDPKVQKQCKDRMRKAKQKAIQKSRKGTRCLALCMIVSFVFCVCDV